MSLTLIVQILVAVLLLFFGRRLYWFFVAAVGFIAASDWALLTFRGAPSWMVILIGLGVGLLGALLAIFVRKAGISLAGLVGGVYIMLSITNALQIANPAVRWVLIFLGAAGGLILAIAFFDWTLILVSSFTGAVFLTRLLPFRGLAILVVIVILAVIGIVSQSYNMEESG